VVLKWATDQDQVSKMQELKKGLNSPFDDIKCFLLPRPGCDSENLWCTMSDIPESCSKYLKIFIPSLLGPGNRTKRKVFGMETSAANLLEEMLTSWIPTKCHRQTPFMMRQLTDLIKQFLTEFSSSYIGLDAPDLRFSPGWIYWNNEFLFNWHQMYMPNMSMSSSNFSSYFDVKNFV
jgi:hypothetical protein